MVDPVQIGNATLYCGDCLEILPTLGKVDAVVTDPPYGIGFRSNYRVSQYDVITNDQSTRHLQWACSIPVNHSRYVFTRWDGLLDGSILRPHGVVTWVKNNWSMGDLVHEHARQSELILFYQGGQHYFPNKRPRDIVFADRTGNEYHPTEKPVSLMRKIVGWTSGCVVDPFMGSGTTGVACAKLGRKFVGIEVEPRYFDIACRRIEQAYAQPDLFIEQPKPTQEVMAV